MCHDYACVGFHVHLEVRMKVDIADYTRFVTHKTAVKAMIGLGAGVFPVKRVAGLVLEAVEINDIRRWL